MKGAYVQSVKKIAMHPLLLTVIRVICGGVFLLFGFVKSIEPLSAFYESIVAYQIVPAILVHPFAWIVLALEIIAGLFLVVGLFTKWSNRVILVLLVLFMIAIVQAMIRGLYLPDCGCSGSFIRLGDTPAQVLLRDGVLFAGALYLEIIRRYGYTLDRFLAHKK